MDFIETTGNKTAEMVCKKYETLKGERVNWDEHWEDLAEYFIPKKDNIYGFRLQGERKHNRLFDTTTIHSLELMASSLHGMLTNPSSVWFGLSTGDFELDKDKQVNQYLQDCTVAIIEALNGSNFQEEVHETYIDLGGIGTTVLAIEEDEETDVNFLSSPIYSSYISENEKGIVDTVYRCFKLSIRNLISKYGEDKFKDIPEIMQKMEHHKVNEKEEVIFGIEPDKENGGFIARHVLRKHKLLLKEKKYKTWPFAVPRWTKLNEEVYGRCPAMKSLPDAKMLNAVMKTTIRGMQKVVDPPMQVPDNGFLLPIKTTPGGTNFYRAGMKDRIEPFPTVARPDIGLDFIENIRQRIRESFFIDQLQLINQRDMTATEVMQRTDERLRFLGPILGRLNNELLKPIIDRVFDILDRRGKLPNAPQILSDRRDLKIIYTSQIAKAQRTAEANTLMKVIQASAPVIEAKPDVMDIFNADNVVRYNARIFGLPEEMLHSEDEVTDVREARAEQMEEQMEAQQQNMAADTAQKNAKAQQ